jgi:hypothetical protein
MSKYGLTQIQPRPNRPLLFFWKGYYAKPEYEDSYVYGRIAGISDIVTFDGASLGIAFIRFCDTVDFYLTLEDHIPPPTFDSITW